MPRIIGRVIYGRAFYVLPMDEIYLYNVLGTRGYPVRAGLEPEQKIIHGQVQSHVLGWMKEYYRRFL
jgi:hypothetical protein